MQTRDGRTLAVTIEGDPQGKPVVVHMGTPNSRMLYRPHVEDAIARGLQLISYDRPGYGGSTPLPGRTIADCAADVRAICEKLEISRVGVWGISGGGPHALACAALLGDLVVAAASLASFAPWGAPGLDYFAGMGRGNVEGKRLALSDPEAARDEVERDRVDFLALTAEQYAGSRATLLTPTDRAALNADGLVEYIVSSGQEGLAPGAQGWWDDGDAFLRPWGFDLDAIEVPVLLMHGREDMFIPLSHGQWLGEHIPGAELRLLERDGHLTLLTDRVPEVHAWLAARL